MSTRVRWLIGSSLLITGLSFAGVGGASVSATDFTSQTIELAQPAQRIVALAPNLVENLYSAGAGQQIVGASQYSDYPPAARKIPRIGGYNSMSLEAIVARHPDLVVAWGSGGTGDLVKRLKALGVPVYIDVPQHFTDIARIIRDLGQLTGHSAVANKAASRFDQRIASLRQRYAEEPLVSLFYVISNQPLQTLSDRGLIGDVFKLCGGRNVFADAPGLAPRVSIESVLARQPQAIVAGDDHGVAWQAFWQQWPSLPAVKDHHLLSISADLISRPSVRIADGASDVCKQLDGVRRTVER